MTEDKFNFYSNDKDIKGEKKNKKNIYQDKSKEDIRFIPSLEMPKKVKKRKFKPSLEMSKEIKKRNFIPSLEMPKEAEKRNFTPSLEISKEVKKRNFIPSLEMPKEVKKRNFIPTLEMPKKKGINKIESPKLKSNYTSKSKIRSQWELKRIRILKNKANIIKNMYEGKFSEKCPECDISTTKLPIFDFHHLNRDSKTRRIKFDGYWVKALKALEKEKTIPICRNCHLKKQAKFYNNFKDIINKKNDFESSLKGIEAKIYQYIYKKGIKYREAYQIKSWIQKRIVIQRLYDGHCIGCGEESLPTLQFHHRDNQNKTFHKYDTLRYTQIEKIEKKLIKDDVVCLCGNCHRMIEAEYYEKNYKKITGINYYQELTNFYDNLKNNIKKYRFPDKILKQYPLIKTEKIEIGWKNKIVSYKLESNEKRIKQEIMNFNWERVSNNWKLPSGQILDPTKECSRTNPLYKHKEWLSTVYNNKNWNLSDEKIARLTNSSQTNINYWRNKLQISSNDPNVSEN